MHHDVLSIWIDSVLASFLGYSLLLTFSVVVVVVALAAFGTISEEKVHPRVRRGALR